MARSKGKVRKLNRPRTRSDCCSGQRPCPWVSCRYHLYLDVNPDTGSIKFNFPDKELWELSETCALDLAESGELTFEEVGNLMNLTRERIRQMTVGSLNRLHQELFPEEEPPRRGRAKANTCQPAA